MSSWDGHFHEDHEVFAEMPHLHAEDADWSLSFGMPMNLHVADGFNVIEMMEFRKLCVGLLSQMDQQRAQIDLTDLPTATQQFTIFTYNVDRAFAEALVQITGEALTSEGIEPPCHLQPVESSNIRSWGYVQLQDEDGTIDEDGTLYVAFKGAKSGPTLYRYDGVPAELAGAFAEAESFGGFFTAEIRPHYEGKRVYG